MSADLRERLLTQLEAVKMAGTCTELADAEYVEVDPTAISSRSTCRARVAHASRSTRWWRCGNRRSDHRRPTGPSAPGRHQPDGSGGDRVLIRLLEPADQIEYLPQLWLAVRNRGKRWSRWTPS